MSDETPTPDIQPLPLGEEPATSTDPVSYSLTEIAAITGIAYPTLNRYSKEMPDLPMIGKGRSRRYLPEAVDKFKEMRATADARKGARAAGEGNDATKPRLPLASRKGPKRGRSSTRAKDTTTSVPDSFRVLMQGVEHTITQAKLEVLLPLKELIDAQVEQYTTALGQTKG